LHEENILGNTQKIPLASFSFSLIKVGIPLVKISAVLTVFETLKNIDFQGGNSHFKKLNARAYTQIYLERIVIEIISQIYH